MTFKKTRLANSITYPRSNSNDDADMTSADTKATPHQMVLAAVNLSDPEMERRMRARAVWEFLDESRSTFYARLNPNDPIHWDPLFPLPVKSSSNGKGPKRWKLGAIIAWLRHCEANAPKA